MFLEKYSSRGEVGRIKMGLISGIIATGLKEEGKHPNEYERGGRVVLGDLANTESLISRINTNLMKNHKETIEKARFLYPKPESRPHLLKLLNVV